MSRLGIGGGPRRGGADEAAIVELLLTLGWVAEVRSGDRAAAQRQVRQTLDRLVDAGLPCHRAASGERRFDPGEVANFAIWFSLETGDRSWLDRCAPRHRRFVWAAHGLEPRPDARPPPPTALPPRRFAVRFERLFNLRGRTAGAPAWLRLPRPIEDEVLRDLKVTAAPSPDTARITAGVGRLDVRLEVPASLEVELGFAAAFTAYPSGGQAAPPPRLDAADRALFTRPAEGLIRVDDAVARLAAELAGDERDPWTQVRRFWDFGLGRLRHGVVHHDEIDRARPGGWVVENGWCDCHVGSALLAALCRARGIPARLVGGYVMDPDTPYHHYWAEAWIEDRGWLPLDLNMSWHFANGGRDPAWRDYYFGRLDYRMKTEVLPHLFNGLGSLRFPPTWHRLSRLLDQGLEMSFHDSADGALIHRDRVAIAEEGAL
ncbi:MAG TPA: transglutaminase-like domain-containing protein [Caulobacteraceae bacterium]|jgi:hypothetical protein|nr:transglutaminase-like domain-containing protein [Caulobacteraceae bacterium]